jgi:tRNA threonylcarbamoyl adenosine modification protein YeaZ
MTARPAALSVAIDTTSDVAGVALFEEQLLLGEVTWRAHQSHSRDLLPTLDWLLGRAQRAKADIGAIVVCLGPGSYAGMRVGISTAKALAYGLGAQIVGVGRLAADAYPIAAVSAGRVVPVQAAGRAELAWAVYGWNDALSPLTPSARSGQALTLSLRERGSESHDSELREIMEPRLSPAAQILECIEAGDAVCGEVEKLNEEVRRAIERRDARIVEAPASRILSVGRLGLQRLARGEFDNAETLVPMYLRAPAIGPQPPR